MANLQKELAAEFAKHKFDTAYEAFVWECICGWRGIHKHEHLAEIATRRIGANKRFSEAELSAEAYRQMARAGALAGMASLVEEDGRLLMAPMDSMRDFIGPMRKDTYMLAVVNRFERLPHFDEEE